MLNKELCRLFEVDETVEMIIDKMEEIEYELEIINLSKSKLPKEIRELTKSYYDDKINEKKFDYLNLRILRDSYCDKLKELFELKKVINNFLIK